MIRMQNGHQGILLMNFKQIKMLGRKINKLFDQEKKFINIDDLHQLLLYC